MGHQLHFWLPSRLLTLKPSHWVLRKYVWLTSSSFTLLAYSCKLCSNCAVNLDLDSRSVSCELSFLFLSEFSWFDWILMCLTEWSWLNEGTSGNIAPVTPKEDGGDCVREESESREHEGETEEETSSDAGQPCQGIFFWNVFRHPSLRARVQRHPGPDGQMFESRGSDPLPISTSPPRGNPKVSLRSTQELSDLRQPREISTKNKTVQHLFCDGPDQLDQIKICPFYMTKWGEEFKEDSKLLAKYFVSIDKERHRSWRGEYLF